VRWTTPALRDIEKIGDDIALDNPVASLRVVTRIFDQCDQLGTYPHMGRAGRVPGTRELVVSDTAFVVPYRVREDEVQVLAVLHGARRWPERFP
jgi:toxin ParE1/3/4